MTGNLRRVSFVLAEVHELVPVADIEGVELIPKERVEVNRGWLIRVKLFVVRVLPLQVVVSILEFNGITSNRTLGRPCNGIGDRDVERIW